MNSESAAAEEIRNTKGEIWCDNAEMCCFTWNVTQSQMWRLRRMWEY